jgi:hypothetical protein
MTRVVIIGEIFNAGVGIGGGPVYPGGGWSGPVDPGYGRPGGGWSPVDPGFGWGGGEHPGNRPPGSWGGEHPGNHPPGSGNYPTGGPIVPPTGGAPVEDYEPLPPPEDVYSQYVVSVWNPKTASWTTKSYPPR